MVRMLMLWITKPQKSIKTFGRGWQAKAICIISLSPAKYPSISSSSENQWKTRGSQGARKGGPEGEPEGGREGHDRVEPTFHHNLLMKKVLKRKRHKTAADEYMMIFTQTLSLHPAQSLVKIENTSIKLYLLNAVLSLQALNKGKL